MTDLKTVDYRDPKAPEIFTQSLVDTGFGIISHHPVDYDLVKHVYKQWQDYFHWDKTEQQPYLFSQKTHDGHIPMDLSETAKGHDIKDIKEFFHYYRWGRCPQSLKTDTQKLYEQMTQLAATLLNWIEKNTPEHITAKLSMPLSKMIENSPNIMLRIIHYPPLTGKEQPGAIRAQAHEDINLITLLPAATAEGLQLLTKENQWLDVPCEPNTIIVNIADMLHECTNGYYHATTHRVINPEGKKVSEPRLSMPLFLHPRPEVKLSERHTCKSYSEERYKELGLL